MLSCMQCLQGRLYSSRREVGQVSERWLPHFSTASSREAANGKAWPACAFARSHLAASQKLSNAAQLSALQLLFAR